MLLKKQAARYKYVTSAIPILGDFVYDNKIQIIRSVIDCTICHKAANE